MNDLVQKALHGVDPGTPGAFWQILHNLLALVPWWPLIWFTVACAVIGAALGWWRGRAGLGIVLGLLVGPVGWLALWAMPPGRHGPARRRVDRKRAPHRTPA
ncbi:MAG: hypothetical protein ACREPF_03470 [Rhodanobacteraceae bacterium]